MICLERYVSNGRPYMGACCSHIVGKHSGRRKKRRRSSLVTSANNIAGSLKRVARRMSLAQEHQLDASKNLSTLYNGKWFEHFNPYKEDQVRAAHVPYIVRRLLLGMTTSHFHRVRNGGCFTHTQLWKTSPAGVRAPKPALEIKVDLTFGTPTPCYVPIFGMRVGNIFTISRALGGNRTDRLENDFMGKVSIRDSMFKLKRKGVPNALFNTI